ncbi:hypothetical protein HG537_0D04640 [Torulaspora globosa]|uniref:CMP/dCMP-type deaminase domain-containing protein n=1 Tax=Torulaspora globosa TaxID=48254 RepID=A0A7H9HRT5_9SACH|nr:hypothetical protein HG537_0D04640 [Torulaspora sp. CBS 2947]
MVKKALNPLKIDYKKCIIEDRLLQIRSKQNLNEPDLARVWTIEIEAKSSKPIIDFIRRRLQPDDPLTFTHIKRIRKKARDSKKLVIIVCSYDLFNSRSSVCSVLAESNVFFENLSDESEIPRQGAPTKELMLEWSRKYWPLTWCGNPNDQILNDYTFDMNHINKMLGSISNLAQLEADKGNKVPVVTAFVNPLEKDKPIYAIDRRMEGKCTPLDHSIMTGIKLIAGKEKKSNRTQAYLCLNYDVYTTHEPCSMCSMALIHSRIKRCIFLQPMQITGCLKSSSGDAYCMHDNRLLNSKYEVFQWLGDEYKIPTVDAKTCC